MDFFFHSGKYKLFINCIINIKLEIFQLRFAIFWIKKQNFLGTSASMNKKLLIFDQDV